MSRHSSHLTSKQQRSRVATAGTRTNVLLRYWTTDGDAVATVVNRPLYDNNIIITPVFPYWERSVRRKEKAAGGSLTTSPPICASTEAVADYWIIVNYWNISTVTNEEIIEMLYTSLYNYWMINKCHRDFLDALSIIGLSSLKSLNDGRLNRTDCCLYNVLHVSVDHCGFILVL